MNAAHVLNQRVEKSVCFRPLTDVLTRKSNAPPGGPHFGSNSPLNGAYVPVNSKTALLPLPGQSPGILWKFFLTLCRLRQGFKEEHLSRITISWVNFMFLKFCIIPVWPSRAKVDQHMTADFKHKYPSARVIIHCTEIRCQMPKSLRLNSEL